MDLQFAYIQKMCYHRITDNSFCSRPRTAVPFVFTRAYLIPQENVSHFQSNVYLDAQMQRALRSVAPIRRQTKPFIEITNYTH